MNQNIKASAALLTTVILWSSAFVGIRYAMSEYSAGGLALVRYLTASIVIIIPFIKIKNKRKPTLADLCFFFILGLLGFSLYNVFLNHGELTVNASVANFIIAQVPIIVTLIAFIVFKERLSTIGIFGFILSFSGICLIMLGESTHTFDIGAILIFLAAVFAASYSSLQKTLFKRYHPIEIVSYSMWLGTLTLLIYTPEALDDFIHSSFTANAWVIYMGIFPGAIAYTLWSYGFKYYPAAKASSYLYLAPFITLMMAWLFLGEIPHILATSGGIVALIGSVIVNRYNLKS